jgi:hypothetical protein
MRRIQPILLLPLALLLLAGGCGSSSNPSGPANSTSFLEGHFTVEEAEVHELSGNSTMLRMVGIDFDGADNAQLTPESKAILDKFSEIFEEYPNAHFSIESHSSSIGADDYNIELTRRRALAVRRHFLVSLDGPRESISTVAYGKRRPLSSGDSPRNERVEIIITDPAGDPTFDLTVSGGTFTVFHDCDGGGATPGEGGDFFISMSLYDAEAGGARTKIASYGPILIQVNSGSSPNLASITAGGEFVQRPGHALSVVVSLYENDTDGRHVDVTTTTRLIYDAEFDCFITDPTTCAMDGSGVYESALLFVGPVFEDPCQGVLQWSLETKRKLG